MLVKNNTLRIIGGLDGKILLIPGLNMIDDSMWDAFKKDKSVQLKIEEELLEEVGAKVDGVEGLLKMANKKAEKLAKETVDRELLSAWKEKEKRASVLKVIDAQLAELANVEFREKSQEDTESDGSEG